MRVTVVAPESQMRARAVEDLSIAEAAKTRDTPALCLRTSKALELEWDAIENIKTAGRQLMLALMKKTKSGRLGKPSSALDLFIKLLQINLHHLSPTHP